MSKRPRMHFGTFATIACCDFVFGAPFQDALAPAGPQAAHIHTLWNIMLGVCGFVFIAVVVALVLALWRAPRATEATPPQTDVTRRSEPGPQRAVIVGVTLSVVGLLALLIVSVATDRALARLPLKDGLVIEVVAHQWWWEVKYEDADPSRIFYTANEMHVPVGRPVLVKLEADDVIHSFWVPNLHGKKDLIPGRTATVQFRADEPGTYRGQCAEFCGYQHANMAFVVVAEKSEDYERWAQAQRASAPVPNDDIQRRGQTVFLTGTCAMCHTVHGTRANGKKAPDLTHLASRQTIAAGTLPNTPGNLAGWIVDPQRLKPGANMPPNPLAPDDLQALLAYLETLK